jgi:hypothetical protein
MMSVNTPSVTPLRWLSEAQRDQLLRRIDDAFCTVISQWIVVEESSAPSIKIATDRLPSTGSCYTAFVDTKPVATLTFETSALRLLLHLPSNAHVDSNDPQSFLSNMEVDLATVLLRQVIANDAGGTVSVKREAPHDKRPWITNASRRLFDIQCDGNTTCGQLELTSTLVNKLIPRGASSDISGLLPRRQAVGKETVLLNAAIGHVELSFIELQQLTEGDVLMMNQMLSSPVLITTAAGQPVAEAVLGRHENQMALQIVSLAASNAPRRSIK